MRILPVFYQQLSYRRDSARRRTLRRSRSLKVNDFGTSRKPVCDLLLVDNTDILSSTLLQLSRSIVKLSLLTGVPLCNALVLRNH